MKVTSIFNVNAISEAVAVQCTADMANGRVNPTIAELFDAAFAGLGLSLTQKGKKGATPRGAFDALRALVKGDAPAKKAIPVGILASGQGWPEVAQALYTYVTALASVGACDKPEALPAWADPVAIAASKAERSSKAAATRAANKAKAEAEAKAKAKAEAKAEAEAEAEAAPVEAFTPTGAANFLIAALRHDMSSVPSALLDQLRALLHVDMPAPVAAPVAEVSMH